MNFLNNLDDPSKLSVAAFTGACILSLFRTQCAYSRSVPKVKSSTDKCAKKITSDDDIFDVCIVGAGPSGSTSAYYLGKLGYKVCLLDKKSFPRHKPCGDAWCAPALEILQDMNVLKKMEADGIVQKVRRGGFISPFGYHCINTDGDAYGTVTGCKTYAIKRYISDEYLVRAAAGFKTVVLMENTEVTNAEFIVNNLDEDIGEWTVHIKSTSEANDSEPKVSRIRSKILLVGDGSTSYLGQKLGLVKKGAQPEAVSSHAYVKGSTHNWTEADGVMVFNKAVLPGYSALFRHYNGDMYLGTYILPGGKATSRAIAPFEGELIENHPYIKDAFGDAYAWEEKRIVAPIRLGGIERSYGRQVMLIGDAAGHVDPLTGEGIHTAMVGAKICAEVVHEMFKQSNFSLHGGRAYELRCYDKFVHEFLYSSIAARVIYWCPMVLDAVAVVGQRRGQTFLDFFGETMTGVRPKSDFLQPLLVVDICLEFVRQFVIQNVLRYPPLAPQDIGRDVVQKQYLNSLKK